MRIGIVCPYNIFRHGGVRESVFAHQKALAARGHYVRILTPRPVGYEGPVPRSVHLVGVSKDINYPFKTKADVSFKSGRREIPALLDKERFDILHFHEPWVPLFSWQILSKSNSVNIATFHAKWPEQFLYRAIGRAIKPYARSIVKHLDYLVAASEPGSHYINKLIGREVPIIFVGIDLSHFDPAHVKPLKKYTDDRKTILFLGRLEDRKGPDLLLKAYREMCRQRDDLRLVIAGDGDMRPSLEQYVADHKLPHVEFLGFVSDSTKLKLYASADVYCAPSPYGEGFGIVLLEAMSMQLPYVAGDNIGYRTASGPRADEYVVNPTDTPALAAKLAKMLDDEAARDSYERWSREYASQYDYEKIVDQYEDIYERLLKKKA